MGRPAWLLLMVCTGMAVLAVGCGRPPAPPAAPPQTLPDPSTLTILSVAPEWTADLPGPVTVSVAPDGETVAGSSPTGPWAYDARGVPLLLHGLTGSAVWALPAGVIVVGPGAADPPGPVSVLSAQGTPLWSAPAVGPVVAVGNVSGDRIVVTDDGADTATELAMGAGGTVRQISLGAGTSAEVGAVGDALVYDAAHVALYSPDGLRRWTQALNPNTPPRTFALDPGAGGVTVATRGNDHSLYQFLLAGSGFAPSPVWSDPLPPGGSNRVTAGPGGRVAVWGLGGTAALAVYRESDGMRLWQDAVPPAAGQEAPALTGLSFTRDGGVVAALSGCLTSGAPCLLVLSPQGSPLGVVPMPAGSRVDLAGDGRAAVAATQLGGTGERLAWYPLTGVVATPSRGVAPAS